MLWLVPRQRHWSNALIDSISVARFSELPAAVAASHRQKCLCHNHSGVCHKPGVLDESNVSELGKQRLNVAQTLLSVRGTPEACLVPLSRDNVDQGLLAKSARTPGCLRGVVSPISRTRGTFAPFSGKVRAILGEGPRRRPGRGGEIGLRDLHGLSKLILPSRSPNTSNCHERRGCDDDAETANAEDLAHASDQSLARVLKLLLLAKLCEGVTTGH